MTLTQYIVDFNLRKSWNAVIAKVEPHMIVFLGDMMDNGRTNVDDSEYVTLVLLAEKGANIWG